MTKHKDSAANCCEQRLKHRSIQTAAGEKRGTFGQNCGEHCHSSITVYLNKQGNQEIIYCDHNVSIQKILYNYHCSTLHVLLEGI